MDFLKPTVPGYRDGLTDLSFYGTGAGALGHPLGLNHPLNTSMATMGTLPNRRSVLNAIDDYLQRDLRSQTGQHQHLMTARQPASAYAYATQQHDSA